MEEVTGFIFLGSKKSLGKVTAATKLRQLLLGRKAMTNLNSIFKKQRYHFADLYKSKLVFPVVMYWIWELDHKEGLVWKKWCFWIVMLEKTYKNPFDSKIKPVNPKGNLPWIVIGMKSFIGGEAPRFGHLMQRGNSLEKTLLLGKTEGRRREGDRGWGDWMPSPTQWMWFWANSRK